MAPPRRDCLQQLGPSGRCERHRCNSVQMADPPPGQPSSSGGFFNALGIDLVADEPAGRNSGGEQRPPRSQVFFRTCPPLTCMRLNKNLRSRDSLFSSRAQLVGKDVWEAFLSDAGESGTRAAAREGNDASPAMGGYKRSRAAASLSSVGSDLLPQVLSASKGGDEELAGVFSSLELSQLLQAQNVSMASLGSVGAAGDAEPVDQTQQQQQQSGAVDVTDAGGAAGSSTDAAGGAMVDAEASSISFDNTKPAINSEELNSLLQAAFLPPPNLAERVSSASGTHSSVRSAGSGGSGKSDSSDKQRPMWQKVLNSAERALLLLEKPAANDVASLQHMLAQFCQEVIPRLAALGPVGVLCQQRLAAFMQEVGLAPGSEQPQSAAAIVLSAQQALSAIKRYVTSGMLAPVIAPRSKRIVNNPQPGGGGGGGAKHRGTLPPQHQQPPPLEQQQITAGIGTDAASSEGDQQSEGGAPGPQLHACKNCQRAKTACDHQRPCARCVRLGVPCDPTTNARVVKRACSACKRSKVKCDFDECYPNPCSRCTRLGMGHDCTPHVPNKKSKKAKGGKAVEEDEDDDPFGQMGSLVAQPGIMSPTIEFGQDCVGSTSPRPLPIECAHAAHSVSGASSHSGSEHGGGASPHLMAATTTPMLQGGASGVGAACTNSGGLMQCSVRSSLSEGMVNDALACLPSHMAPPAYYLYR